jgi:hypothetical protein
MSTQETTTKTETSNQKKAKASKKAAKAKKAATPKKTAKATKAKSAAKPGSKASIVLDLMKRKEGATLAEIAKATDWQNHSIRGFVSGHVIKKMGLKVESTKSEAGENELAFVEHSSPIIAVFGTEFCATDADVLSS